MDDNPGDTSSRGNAPIRSVLVVSDNPELTAFLQEVIAGIPSNEKPQVEFRHTVVNGDPERMRALGAEAIDIKAPETVAMVIGQFDLVLSLHCKQIFPRELVEQVRCINVHPGMNPYNRGWFPQAFSIVNGLPAGATIHVMDAEVDHGDILAQRAVEISAWDTSMSAYRKVLEAEKALICQTLPDIFQGNFRRTAPAFEGNYNTMQDYKDLCVLDLDNVATLREHLNVLRATTHPPYRNAYFLDQSGTRHYVSIVIETEAQGQSPR